MSPDVFKTLFSVLLTTDLVGNSLVILIILNNRSMKTPMNYLLLNLAVADMMVGAFFAPPILFMSTFTHPTGTAGDVLCKLITGKNLAWLGSLVSTFTLVLVAIERFYAVVHPLNFRRKITKRKVRFIVPACWILATVITIPSFLGDQYKEESCSEWLPHRWQNVSYAALWLASAGVIPVGVMLVLYLIVIHSLWFKDNNSGDGSRVVLINSRKRITKMMITVSIIYALCCLPTHIMYIIYAFYPGLFGKDETLFPLSYCLIVLNSSINPFVYTFQFEEFRKYLKKIVCCKRQEGQQCYDTTKTFAASARIEHTGGENETSV